MLCVGPGNDGSCSLVLYPCFSYQKPVPIGHIHILDLTLGLSPLDCAHRLQYCKSVSSKSFDFLRITFAKRDCLGDSSKRIPHLLLRLSSLLGACADTLATRSLESIDAPWRDAHWAIFISLIHVVTQWPPFSKSAIFIEISSSSTSNFFDSQSLTTDNLPCGWIDALGELSRCLSV